MVDELPGDRVAAGEQRHLQRVQQARPQVVRDLPADDLAGNRSVTNAVLCTNPQAAGT
jgi:hypothetical protein